MYRHTLIMTAAVVAPPIGNFTVHAPPFNVRQANHAGLLAWRMTGNTTIGISWSNGVARYESRPLFGSPTVKTLPLPLPVGTKRTWGNSLLSGGWVEVSGTRLQRIEGTPDGWNADQTLQYVIATHLTPDGDGVARYEHHQFTARTQVSNSGNIVYSGVLSDVVLGDWTDNVTGYANYRVNSGYTVISQPVDFLKVSQKPTEDGHSVTWTPDTMNITSVRKLTETVWYVSLDNLQLRQTTVETVVSTDWGDFETLESVKTRLHQNGQILDWTPIFGGVLITLQPGQALTAGNWQVEHPTVQGWQGLGVMGWTSDSFSQLSSSDKKFWQSYQQSGWYKPNPPFDVWESKNPTRMEWSANGGSTWTTVTPQGWLSTVSANPPDPDGPDQPQKPPVVTHWRFTFADLDDVPEVWSVQMFVAGQVSATLRHSGQTRQNYTGQWLSPDEPPAGITLTVQVDQQTQMYGATLMTATRNP